MPRGVSCKHEWVYIGRAPDFAGSHCVTYRCQICRDEWELFAGIKPTGPGSRVVKSEPPEEPSNDR